MEIYERIKELRKNNLKMSQTEFGDRLGVSRSVINNIENNYLKNPEQKEPIYKLICKEFHISYQWLMTGEGDMYMDDTFEAQALVDSVMTSDNERAKAVFKAFAKLSEDEWKVIYKIMDEIKKPDC